LLPLDKSLQSSPTTTEDGLFRSAGSEVIARENTFYRLFATGSYLMAIIFDVELKTIQDSVSGELCMKVQGSVPTSSKATIFVLSVNDLLKA
jgi:hypothetical protein